MTPKNESAIADEELVITREFNAPRDLVWKAWTEAERLAQWWGPKGFKMHVAKLDFRPGGVFHYCMTPPGKEDAPGAAMWGKFTYKEIEKPERIVFVSGFSDEKGGVTRNPWMATWPLEVLNNQTFEEKNGKTTVTLRGGPINATEEERKAFVENRKGMQQGFAGTFSQLDEYLARMQE